MSEEKKYVKIEKDVIDSLVNRVEELEKEKTSMKKLEEITTSTARMRRIDDKIVLRIVGKSWEEYNEKTREDELWVEIELIGKDKKKEKRKMRFIDLRASEVVIVPIVDKKTEVKKESQGTTEIKKVEGYKTVETGEEAEMVVVSQETTYTLDLPSIGKLEVEANSLNI